MGRHRQPVLILLIPCIWLSFVILMPSEIKQLKGMDHFEDDMKQLGSISRKEKLFLIVFGLTLILWFTDRVHGVSTQVISLISVAVLSLPGIDVFNWRRDSADVNWDAIMLVGGATSFGAMLTKTGVITWFAHEYLMSFSSLPLAMLFLCICVVMIISQFPIPAGAGAVATLAPAFLAVAEMGNFNPAGVIMVVALSQAAPILSPAVCFYPIINSTGLLSITRAWKTGFFIAIAETALILASMFTVGSVLNFL